MELNKLDAAGRQLDAAIRMFFGEEDPVAVHTVTSAAFTVVRNLCEKRGNIDSFRRFSRWIKPGSEGKFWSAVNGQANFLKHADRDADDLFDFNEGATELLILMAAKWFIDLGNDSSPEIRAFGAWFVLMHPDMVQPAVIEEFRKASADFYPRLKGAFEKLDPHDHRRAGNEMLSQMRQALNVTDRRK
ncbi:hypothetical protein [Bradyrhizobium sp.]|uniref:hypothetical protein n=1 Tax=Bradyrhizobium sp. TaxID=376 RepID=UPI00260E1B29|nr:hypothetical protein [Bradyrhizobium sp.]